MTDDEVKPKLASGFCARYLRNRVFVSSSLVADSPQKNTFRYDQLVSGRGVYAYVGGNPISNVDPLGLWSISANIYIGPGFEVTFGNDNGHDFMTGRVGLGIGAGFTYDKDGKIPGPKSGAEQCEGGVVLAATAKGGIRSGPFGFGLEAGAARNYTTEQSELFFKPTATFKFPSFGVSASASIGAQYTIYNPRR